MVVSAMAGGGGGRADDGLGGSPFSCAEDEEELGAAGS